MDDPTEFQNIVLLIDSVGPEDPLGPNAFGARTFPSISGAYDGPADESPAPTDMTAQLLEMRQAGCAILQWLSNPDVACPIPRITLTLGNLNTQFWNVNQRLVNDLPGGYREEDMEALGLPTRPFRHINMEAWRDMGPNESAEFLGCWKGRAAPGVLFIEHIVRRKWGPWSAELCKVAYEQVAELSTLKSIFVCHIMNTNTRPQVREIAPMPESKLFICGTPGYQTLLGTRIGKVVAYFILGAFGQGVKRIPRIEIWYIGQRHDILQMRFDLEDIGRESYD